ncbi:MAG: hypothetical protein WAK67_13875, partial [Xanthobacteraceae bacterium]
IMSSEPFTRFDTGQRCKVSSSAGLISAAASFVSLHCNEVAATKPAWKADQGETVMGEILYACALQTDAQTF